MKEKILLTIWVFISIVLAWTNICFGYLDPSAMTYLIQVVAGVIIAASTSIGILFYKLKRKFSKKKKENNIEENIEEQESKEEE